MVDIFTVNLFKLLSLCCSAIHHMRDKEANSSFNNVLIIITIKILLIVLDLTLLYAFVIFFWSNFMMGS